MQRYLSIDILRGLAILLMIQVHFVENLSPREETSASLYDASEVLGAFAAPIFTFVSGLSFFLWARKLHAEGRRDTTPVALRRGLFLFVVGIAFNVAVWLPEDAFNWDILTLIGTALMVLALARTVPAPALLLACFLILLISPIAREVCEYRTYWNHGAFEYDFTVRDIVFGYVANGYFPLLPWLIFPLAGFLAAEPIVRGASTRLLAVGAGLLALAGLGAGLGPRMPANVRRYADGLTEFPASTTFVLGMLGVVLISEVLLHRWLDRPDTEAARPATGILGFFRRYSELSLSIYVLHHVVILWPMWGYAIWTRQPEPTLYWRKAMSAPMALALAGVFIVVCTASLGVFEKHRKLTIEWWMRRICG